jgi:3-methyladenine DNA glycosylase AlkD
MSLKQIQTSLENLNNPSQAQVLSRFFKTGKGQYGEGDYFRGIKVPQIREVVKKYGSQLSVKNIITLLHSGWHEDRLCALLLFVSMIRKADDSSQLSIYSAYMSNTAFINNWDLVDLSAPQICGFYLQNRSRAPLFSLVKSDSLWERRIAVISTFHYIKQSSFDDSLCIIEKLLSDKEDLIHKAAGWMLREIGKRDLFCEQAFLKKHYDKLPRTTLRYAIERFPENIRLQYLKGSFE